MKIFITGAAGFIGFHLSERLLRDGHQVCGYDGLTPYYDPELKRARLALLNQHDGFAFTHGMLEDQALLTGAVGGFAPDIIVHLAAQPGVRYGLENPQSYVSANMTGTFNLLEAARQARPTHLMIGSTSAVYGGNTSYPFRETDRTDFPISIYAATKRAAEALTHSYAHLHDLPTTCMRFFTVYGPWGRPDMALFKFVEAISADRQIEIYGHGQMQRDFTYIDDLIEAVVRLMTKPPRLAEPAGTEDSLSPVAPWRSVNIAGSRPVALMDFIAAIETAMGRKARKVMVEGQPGDVTITAAGISLLQRLTDTRISTNLGDGVAKFVAWYQDYQRPI